MSSAYSIRRRLLLRIGGTLVVLLAVIAFGFARYAEEAARRSFDQLLSASALTIAGSMRLDGGGLTADVPTAAFAMLAAARDDRVFYRLLDDDGRTVTGYADLPFVQPGPDRDQAFYDADYRGFAVRTVAVRRLLTSGVRARWGTVLVAQTTGARDRLTSELSDRTLLALLAMAAVAAMLILLGVADTLKPVVALKSRIEGRDPTDFSPIADLVPDEVEPLKAALNALLTRFKTSLDETRSFLADAAHQLRTPLASLMGQTELALREAGSGAMAERLGRIDRNVRLAARIVDQLLSDASVSNRLESTPKEPVDLVHLAAEVINDLVGGAGAHAIRLYVEDDVVDPMVRADAGSLAEALRNLIDNAMKYAPPAAPIDVSIAGAAGDGLVLTVADRGPGIRAADRPRVLGRFERGDAARAPVGSGLGLAIVARVVAAHGGQLALRDRAGGGLAAEITLRRDAKG
ncbi:sensor histidine kinase [Labrys wisconsinensis]|uniref:histidine kinase n=1 Tax=Labrys wisconsinensis TaxID=425677 RepID=A0ABU0J430_9HYPH|nr:sensor histidine kinase [Labrys wisconsinensis]MDQ0468375.1 two-component system sensor histidine kinase TctE [Labrys wisconsinensis]